jgi:hypothetical protein
MNHTNLIKILNTLYIIKKILFISKGLNKPKESQRMSINQNTNAKIILKNTYKNVVIVFF